MILGIGVDIVEVDRIRTAHARFGEKFLRRFLRPEEMALCLGRTDPAPCAAARFAAKEAVSKAFGTGIGAELGWTDIEVGHLPGGAPSVILHGSGLALQQRRGVTRIHVSLSHGRDHAVAQVVLEG